MDVSTRLKDEVMSEIEGVSTMTLGSAEHGHTVEAVNGMIDRLVKLEQVETDKRKLDLESEKLRLEEEKRDLEELKVNNEARNNKIRNVITVATTVLTVGVTIWANVDSKRFEQGFTHTTEAGRTSTRKLLGLLDKLKNN